MQGQWFFRSRTGWTKNFNRVLKISISFWGLPLPVSTSPGKLIKGGLTSPFGITIYMWHAWDNGLYNRGHVCLFNICGDMMRAEEEEEEEARHFPWTLNQVLRCGLGFRGVYVISSITQGKNHNGLFYGPKVTILRSLDPGNGIRDPELIYFDHSDKCVLLFELTQCYTLKCCGLAWDSWCL